MEFRHITLIILVIIFLIYINLINCYSNENCTTFMNPYENVLLSRRKRYLFYPAGGSVVVTMSFAKAVISNTPRGLNLVAEMDFYYPLPDRVSDFDTITDLKKLRKFIPFPAIPDVPTTPAPVTKPTDDPPLPMIIEDSHIYEHPFYEHASDELQFPNFLKNDHNRNFDLNKKNVKTMMKNINDYANHRKNYWLNSKQFWMQNNINNNNNKRSLIKNNNYKYIIPTQYENSNIKFNIENFKHWEHYNGHKERRDLYNQLERISIFKNFEMRSCILRMICEANYYLLPPGKSLFEDIFRILFSVPIMETLQDDYANAMRNKKHECQTMYETKCPISILGYLLHRNRQSLNQF